MRRPFVWFAAGLIAGIMAGRYLKGFSAAAVLTICLLICGGLAFKNRIWEYMYIPVISIIGFMLCVSALGPADFSAENLTGKDVDIKGTVRNYYITESGKTAITLDAVSITDGIESSGENLKIFIISDKASISAGNIIEAKGRLYNFDEPANPYQINYKIYMKSRGYDYSFWCETMEVISSDSNGFIYKIEKIRERVNEFFDMNLPERESAMAKALTTGYKYDIADNTEQIFRNLGISHVLAVSGLHVSLVSGFMFFVLSSVFRIRKRLAAPLVSVFLIIYFVFSGCSPSAARAVIMALTAFAALILYRNSDKYNTIAFSAFILLCMNPLYLWNVSFRLSYIGITSVSVALDMERSMERVSKWTKTFLISAIIWTITTPLTMYYFGGVSLIAPVANILVVPYLSVITGVSLLTGVFSATSVGFIAARILDILFCLYEFLTEKIPSEILYMQTAKPSAGSVIVMYLFIICIIFCSKNYIKKIAVSMISVFAVLYVIINSNAPAEIIFFDVGQGDAAVIHVPGEITAVVDGGPQGEAESSVIPYLKAKAEKADILFITHMDSDHSSGAIELIKNDLVQHVVISEADHSEILYEIIAEAEKHNIDVHYASAGDSLITDSCKIDCLYPFSDIIINNENSSSLVLNVNIDGTKILFTGDIEYRDEKRLMNSEIECDIIKIPHHGSKTSSSPDFIEKTGADIAVIEAGENNIYGFPDEQVIKTLDDNNIDTYITGKDGAVTVRVKNGSASVETFKKTE